MRGFVNVTLPARDHIVSTRPELAADFEPHDDFVRIPLATLLRPTANPPGGPFSLNSEPGTRNPEPTRRGLGDVLAEFLRRLRIDALVALLQRHGLHRECGCAARQARLNALTPRLRAQFEPWSLTLAVLLSWLLFAVVLLAR